MKLKCRKCGNEELFYKKEKYSGANNNVVNNEGEDTEYNAGMYDNAEHKLTSVYYCCECHSKVTKIPVDELY